MSGATKEAMEKYPVIENIKKNWLMENEEISDDQVRGYCRRVLNSPMLEQHVKLIQLKQDSNVRLNRKLKQTKKDLEVVEMANTETHRKLKEAIRKCVDAYGYESDEFQTCFSHIPRHQVAAALDEKDEK